MWQQSTKLMTIRPTTYPMNDLKKSEIRVVGEAGNADDGERAGLGRDDGERNRPPGDFASSEKIVAQSALLFPKTQAEQRDACQVEGDDREIEFVQAHAVDAAKDEKQIPPLSASDGKRLQFFYTTLRVTLSAGS